MVVPTREFLPARKSTRRQKAAVCVVEYVGVFSRYIYPIRYVDASVFTHAGPHETTAECKLMCHQPDAELFTTFC
jgi:hypothetical protein